MHGTVTMITKGWGGGLRNLRGEHNFKRERSEVVGGGGEEGGNDTIHEKKGMVSKFLW